jgi:hypothetical protein
MNMRVAHFGSRQELLELSYHRTFISLELAMTFLTDANNKHFKKAGASMKKKKADDRKR